MLTTLAQRAWLHDLDPVLLPISGGIAIRWYGLAYIAGFVVAWLLMRAMARRGLINIRAEYVGDAILAAIVGVLVGGRLGYALVYAPHLFVDFSPAFPFWGLLDLTRGGMASHGGMVGLVGAAWWVARREKTRTLHVLDALALVAPPGIFFGRLANFVNGELLGKVVAGPDEKQPWWSVRYPQELLDRPSPEQVEAMRVIAAQTGLAPDDRGVARVAREIVAGVRAGEAEVIAFADAYVRARHPSQLYQAVAEGLLVFVVLWAIWRTPRRPGVISAWFLMVYGVGRIATEFIRLPDVGVSTTLGLSRGQWLSALMVLVGAGLLAFVRVRARSGSWDEPVGGWARKESDADGGAAREDGEDVSKG